MAREKKTRRRTVADRKRRNRHIRKSVKTAFAGWSSEEAQSEEEQYRVSLLPPVIGVCIKDVHCISTVVVPADQPVPLASVSLQPAAHANMEWSLTHLSCFESQSPPLDFGLIFAVWLRSDNQWPTSFFRLPVDLKPLQLNYTGDINTWGTKLTPLICDNSCFLYSTSTTPPIIKQMMVMLKKPKTD